MQHRLSVELMLTTVVQHYSVFVFVFDILKRPVFVYVFVFDPGI